MKIRTLAVAACALAMAGSASAADATREVAVFAGGCFWSMQKVFDHVPGVVDTQAGFMGGPYVVQGYWSNFLQISNQPHESVRLVAMPQSDGLAARLPQSSLTLGKAPRQSHHLAAAFINLPTALTLTGKRANTVNLTVAKVSLVRSLSASRAPPALVA